MKYRSVSLIPDNSPPEYPVAIAHSAGPDNVGCSSLLVYYFDALSGAGEDRIFMANTRSQVAHFNGHRWNLVPGTETYTGIFYNLDAGSDGFCAVGRTRKNVPIMLIGRHR
jgi:hypothetical protein